MKSKRIAKYKWYLHNHRQNLAERVIQTFKNHFKSVLAGVDDSFLMRLWDKLLSQVILTLNLLQQSNVAPTNRRMYMSMVPLITMQCLWHQWDVQYRYMRAQTGERHGQRIRSKDGTYTHPQSIIGAT